MRHPRLRARVLVHLTLAATAAAGALVVTAPTAAAACSDVEVVFARGTGETPGLGIVGRPFATALASQLSDRTVTSYAVDYAANSSQTSAGPGATDMSTHLSSVAASCPGTSFVIGGYSQGATVTDLAVGIRTGVSSGTPIPTALAPRVKAVVVFGNPLGLQRQTIASASSLYGSRSKDFCNTNDSVCGRYQPTGSGSHLSYASNGSTVEGATFAAALVRASSPTDPTTPVPSTCVRASTADHVDADRAAELFDRAYARGTNDPLGTVSRFNYVSLRSTGTGGWARVTSC